MLVSAIVPTHDRPQLLDRAIRSIEIQTYKPIELVVVGSPKTPDVTEIVQRADVYSTQYIDAKAKSPGAARNIGIDRAHGEWLAFLDDDDEWLPTKIERQLDRAKETGSDVCHTGIKKVGPDGNVRAISHPKTEGTVTEELLTQGPYGSLSAMMVRRKTAKEVDGFDANLVTFEDNDFNIRVSIQSRFCTVPDDLVIKHSGENRQVSNDMSQMASDAEYFIDKHRQLALNYGSKTAQQMRVRVKHGIGQTAANQGMYSKARQYFLEALQQDPTHYQSMFWLLLVAGGPISFRTAQATKRLASHILNEI